VIRRALPRLSIGLAAVQIFLSFGAAAVWPLADAVAQDDPSQWPADQKVEKAIERLKDLKDTAQQFSRRDCPTGRADYDAWLNEGLDLAGSLIGLQDSTRQIRKTGAGADKLRTWDAVRVGNGADGLGELTDLLDRCGRRVRESDAAFRPPSREELVRRAVERARASLESGANVALVATPALVAPLLAARFRGARVAAEVARRPRR